ncbi:hypothetical protein [Ferroacidibacillus organovorans]|uniref:Carbonic anhydrase n=1 Tax=Ferroacidibacillus organovorans TaxID=1765683 RepID=A0A101XQE4_9BACL|nr:hypothetical protein [Ferroacidibacillus organovorans]KUO95654.1 hypothetical protein ATW55_14580 [Ferroacidibacillus organovorans]
MYFDGNKKALFLTGMDQELQPLLQRATEIKPENVMMLQTYGPEISQPYGDLMRDIIVAVYQEKVEDIFVVGIKGEQRNAVNMRELQNKICEQEEKKEEIKTIDFVLKHCVPEFPGVSLNEWLEGSTSVIEGLQKSVQFLRDHPLIPTDLSVYGLLMDKESGELIEIQAP